MEEVSYHYGKMVSSEFMHRFVQRLTNLGESLDVRGGEWYNLGKILKGHIGVKRMRILIIIAVWVLTTSWTVSALCGQKPLKVVGVVDKKCYNIAALRQIMEVLQ